MKSFIVKGVQYFFMLQASILIAMLVVTLLLVIPIRFIIESTIGQLWVMVALGFALETAFILFCFYKEKMEFKRVSLSKFVSPCIIAVILHSALSAVNGFYMYTAGISVSELGIIWESYCSKTIIKDMRDVELFRLIIPFVIILAFRIGTVFLSYYIGKKRIDRAKRKLVNK